MALIRQFAIIAGVSCLGEGLRMLIPLPIPASVYGLVLMLLGLMTGVIRLEKVQYGAAFLIEIMPLLFVPAAVGLTRSWSQLAPVWLPVLAITLITTVIVMGCVGRLAQGVIRLDEKRRDPHD